MAKMKNVKNINKGISYHLIIYILLLINLTCPLYAEISSNHDKIAIIMHKESKINNLSLDQLSMIFRNRLLNINGKKIIPVNLSSSNPLRLEFIDKVLKSTPFEMKQYWLSVRIKGQGKPPKAYSKTETIQKVVEKTPGMIGYINYFPGLEKTFNCLKIDGENCNSEKYPLIIRDKK